MTKKVFRWLTLFFMPFIASLLIRFLFLTNKKNFFSPKNISKDPVIFACWHGELLMLPYIYKKYRTSKNLKAKVLISDHFDGLLISKTIKYFGIGTIAGSTNRNAARALIQAIKNIKQGYDIGITPDGPKGPRHSISDGLIAMAQKTGAKIVLVEIKPTKFWQLNSWDKFTIPKPFGTINYYSTSEIDISDLEMEKAREYLKKRLLEHEN